MLRILAAVLAASGMLIVSNVYALGLGGINTLSKYNEPLNAEIRFMQAKGVSADEIIVRVADAAEFSSLGLRRSPALNNMTFNVRFTSDESGVILLTTHQAISDQVLSLLVEVNWPGGKVLREYTVVLELPKKESQPAFLSTEPRKENGWVVVSRNDTLWALAENNLPNQSITPQQMMIAMQRLNPEVFPTGNVNVIESGMVMKIPTLGQLHSIPPEQARLEVRRQNIAWRQQLESRVRPAKAVSQPVVIEEPIDDVNEERSDNEVALVEGVENTAVSDEVIVAEALKEKPLTTDQQKQYHEGLVFLNDNTEEQEGSAVEEMEINSITVEDSNRLNNAPTALIPAKQDKEVSSDLVEQSSDVLEKTDLLDDKFVEIEKALESELREEGSTDQSAAKIQEQLLLMQRMLELQTQQISQLETQRSAIATLDDSSPKIPYYYYIIGLLALAVAFLLGRLLSGSSKEKHQTSEVQSDPSLQSQQKMKEEVDAEEDNEHVAPESSSQSKVVVERSSKNLSQKPSVGKSYEGELDAELDVLLSSTDDEIALEELITPDESFDSLEGASLLGGGDEVETKLDLVRAYLGMDDFESAKDILKEILFEGSDQQKEEAQRLLNSLD